MNPTYVFPRVNEAGIATGYDYEEIEKLVIKYKVKSMIFTSPTYEGVILDTDRLYEISKKHGCYLIIDEAHGGALLKCKPRGYCGSKYT